MGLESHRYIVSKQKVLLLFCVRIYWCYATHALHSSNNYFPTAILFHYNKRYNNLSGVNKKPLSKASGEQICHAQTKHIAPFSPWRGERGVKLLFWGSRLLLHLPNVVRFQQFREVMIGGFGLHILNLLFNAGLVSGRFNVADDA